MATSTETKIVYIGILRNAQPDPIELCCERELSSYSRFTRGSISEFTTMFSKILTGHVQNNSRKEVHEKEFVFHVYSNNDGITGVAITNEGYPSRIAAGLIGKIVNEFCVDNRDAKTATGPVPFPALKEYIDKYQRPQNVDNITQITEQLEDTKVTLHKTIESLLERGEKLDDLVQKSEGLSSQSKMFYTSAKKQNSCCIIM
ncbi:palmitoyltransferase YKT6 [Aspergillus puulaauensis]|uniref:Palmitoyltransferase n=1 Tax=Aspergillus puulaauensis TaxID=1220207 RepID=A0A7R8AR65_9EURO|nr:palmitoyltransferase [Aspergillus puulaauensis]BCS28151.1 palmitoyltransferase [Aspergillus puulaauensis]